MLTYTNLKKNDYVCYSIIVDSLVIVIDNIGEAIYTINIVVNYITINYT